MRLPLKEHFPDLPAITNRDKKDRTVGNGVPEVYSMSPFSDCPHTSIDWVNLIELALAVGDMVFEELRANHFSMACRPENKPDRSGAYSNGSIRIAFSLFSPGVLEWFVV
jgi:hypothetical protein